MAAQDYVLAKGHGGGHNSGNKVKLRRATLMNNGSKVVAEERREMPTFPVKYMIALGLS